MILSVFCPKTVHCPRAAIVRAMRGKYALAIARSVSVGKNCQLSATTSISTNAPLGKVLTATAERAG